MENNQQIKLKVYGGKIVNKTGKFNLSKDIKIILCILSVAVVICLIYFSITHTTSKNSNNRSEHNATITTSDYSRVDESTTKEVTTTETSSTKATSKELFSLSEIDSKTLELLKGSSNDDEKYEQKDWAKEKFNGKNHENTEIDAKISENIVNPQTYKHISTEYQYITNQQAIEEVNDLLSKYNYSLTIQYGDVCSITKFLSKDEDGKKTQKTAVSLTSVGTGKVEICYIV